MPQAPASHPGSAEPTTSCRWQRRRAARPGELVQAALELFVEHGFAATRREDVAARAGVTKGTLYLYFPGKDHLFRAVAHHAIGPEIALMEIAASDWEGTASDLIRFLVDRLWTLFATTALGGLPKLLIAEVDKFPDLATFFIEAVCERVRALYRNALIRGVERGEFLPLDIEASTRLAIGPLIMTALWRHSLAPYETTALDPARLMQTHLDIFLRGIRRTDPPT